MHRDGGRMEVTRVWGGKEGGAISKWAQFLLGMIKITEVLDVNRGD